MKLFNKKIGSDRPVRVGVENEEIWDESVSTHQALIRSIYGPNWEATSILIEDSVERWMEMRGFCSYCC